MKLVKYKILACILFRSLGNSLPFWFVTIILRNHELLFNCFFVFSTIITILGLYAFLLSPRNKIFAPIFKDQIDCAPPPYVGKSVMQLIDFCSQDEIEKISDQFKEIPYLSKKTNVNWIDSESALDALNKLKYFLESKKISFLDEDYIKKNQELESMIDRVKMACLKNSKCSFIMQYGGFKNNYTPDMGFWI